MVFLIQIVYNNIEPNNRLIINTVTVYISNHKKKVRGQIISATQYAANKRLGVKLCPLYGDIFVYGVYMDVGKLYFVNDSFYERFNNHGLLGNKEIINGSPHNRPCCYLFKYDEDIDDIYWLIPISSKIDKYKKQYQKAIAKYGKCDNISFGYVLGKECAFLPQNLFPITSRYINNVYIDKNTSLPISVPPDLMAELNAKARKKIRYNQQGKLLGMTDIMKIYNELKQDSLCKL